MNGWMVMSVWIGGVSGVSVYGQLGECTINKIHLPTHTHTLTPRNSPGIRTIMTFAVYVIVHCPLEFGQSKSLLGAGGCE